MTKRNKRCTASLIVPKLKSEKQLDTILYPQKFLILVMPNVDENVEQWELS